MKLKKNPNVTKLKNSKCDETQQLKWRQNSKTPIVTNSKTQIVTKVKTSNCDKNQDVTSLKL